MSERYAWTSLYQCRDCCNEVVAFAKPKVCPGCGEDRMVRVIEHERQKGDDDGVEYSDPRDEREERRRAALED